jgi:hypothetical protein
MMFPWIRSEGITSILRFVMVVAIVVLGIE